MPIVNPSEGQTLLATCAATVAAQLAVVAVRARLLTGEDVQDAVVAAEMREIAAGSVRLAAAILDEVVRVQPV